MGVLYLLALLIGITCMLLLDRRFTLFFWHDPGAALLVTVVGVVLFLVWDIAGIRPASSCAEILRQPPESYSPPSCRSKSPSFWCSWCSAPW